MNLVDGWNKLVSVIPGGLLAAMTVVGVAIIVIFVLKWVWDGRRGGGGTSMKTFPWMAVIFGAILAGPQLVVPALLSLLQALLIVGVTLFKWFAGLLGG